MSASARSIKNRMFGFLKDWLLQPIDDRPESQPPLRGDSPVSPKPAPQPVPSKPAPRSSTSASVLELPLPSILGQMSPELQSRVCVDASAVSVSIPIETVLPQLAYGSVKITFGELRQAAPGVFSTGNDHDHLPVQLPLAEVLSRLDPVLLARRPVQKHFEVPAEVTGPFSQQGQGLIFSVGQAKPQPAALAPPVRATRPATTTRPSPTRGTIRVVPPMSRPPTQPTFRSTVLPSVPSVPRPATTWPFRPAPGSPLSGVDEGAMGADVTPVRPITPRPAVQAVPSSVQPNGAVLMVPLSDLTGTWTEALRHEIALLNLSKAIVALPMEIVEAGLKQGRVACSWKQLRAWIRPAPDTPAISVHDATVLNLPLKVVAPLFLAKQRAAKAQKKVAVDEDIPNLFFGSAQPEAASVLPPVRPAVVPPAVAPVPSHPKAADTNYYVWKDDADSPIEPEQVFKRGPASPGTDFLKRYATPNEIVSRAAALDGVAGALISLPDGLLVASRIPAELNADTVAAFLPQIFGRVSQCTKELRMGDLNNLNFTVGNVPWKIFRVGAIFFAAFGRAGEPLPTRELAGLAAELDRKPK